jgi:hypothetical protein
VAACLVVAVPVLSVSLLSLRSPDPAHHGRPRVHPPGPAVPAARVCGNNSILGGGPTSPPHGAVVVRAGNDSSVDWGKARTTYWFAPGRHTLGGSVYAQVIPGPGSRYIGAPGAVLDGRNVNAIAFGGDVPRVTIEYLTIENFIAPGNQGAVNASGAAGWVIKYDTVQDIVPGTAVYAGTNAVIEHDCLTRNGQSGFGTYTVHDVSRVTKGASNVVVDDNEISYNDTCNWEAESHFPGPPPPRGCRGAGENHDCGCSAGGKFWQTDGGEFDDNYVTDNYSVGVWWDTNNTGFRIEGNYISGNYADGLIYEISYNALIRDNTFVRNGLGAGAAYPGVAVSAIYISQSGSDPRAPGPYGSVFEIAQNTFEDNWGGVLLWENANRFCNSPANTSAGSCTLVNPAVTLRSCNRAHIAQAPYYSDCRWKTQNVLVEHNLFYLQPKSIGRSCTASRGCGWQGLFSEYGSYPSWSPYTGSVTERRITFDQDNRFTANTYVGPWRFLVIQQGKQLGWRSWRAGPYHQDGGSVRFRTALLGSGGKTH